jgi:predicted membrane GTPase involved in stress response
LVLAVTGKMGLDERVSHTCKHFEAKKSNCRGLLGIRSVMLTATKGLAVLNTNFKEYGRWVGDIVMRDNGSLVSFDTGPSSSYALESIQVPHPPAIRNQV